MRILNLVFLHVISLILNFILITNSSIYQGEKNVLQHNDFREIYDDKQAKKWGKLNYDFWLGHQINHDQKVALIHYALTPWHYNSYLRTTKGNLLIEKPENIDIQKWDEYQKNYVNKRIKNMDSALDLIKTKEGIIVYRRLNEDIFLLENDSLRLNNKKQISPFIFRQLKNKYENTTMKDDGFVSTSLTTYGGEYFHPKNRPIIWKLHVPKGIHGAYLGGEIGTKNQNEFVLKRGHTFKYERFTIIKEFGLETLKIDVTIVDK